ncbi:hypothetical protein [Bdellovibrio svalbardensis]|uniref:Uncharacterized protein n=1 Tax=Bdellovibrio svalbardensis TaxID=2972972 RepID=A0ABT6DM20_9BACT|nr:hypothetical protein [Bdellovibrio svalbardensis]MDG0817115.1 hypothetical protein [Bdellovibrio svalbardensis]
MDLILSSLLSFALIFLGVSKCHAKVDVASTKPLVIPVDNVTPKLTSDDVAKVIPCDSSVSGSSASNMMVRIADRTFNYWFNSPAMKASMLGRAVDETQERLKTDVVVPASSAQGTTHKFSFRVEAFQALAKMEYSGWMKAAINYDAKASATDILLKEKVFNNKELVVSHQAKKDQDLSMIGLAWQW